MYTNNSIVKMDVTLEDGVCVTSGTMDNYSSILTRLIQDTGRFCLHYASDLFILWDVATMFLGQISVWGGGQDEVGFAFGIREDGVDDAGSVAQNLAKGLNYYYRMIYVLETSRKDGTIYMSLYKADKLKSTGAEPREEKPIPVNWIRNRIRNGYGRDTTIQMLRDWAEETQSAEDVPETLPGYVIG